MSVQLALAGGWSEVLGALMVAIEISLNQSLIQSARMRQRRTAEISEVGILSSATPAVAGLSVPVLALLGRRSGGKAAPLGLGSLCMLGIPCAVRCSHVKQLRGAELSMAFGVR